MGLEIRVSLRKLARTYLLAGVAGLALALGAIGANAADREHTLIIGSSGQVNTLDPLRADYAQTILIVNVLYDTLVDYDDSGNVIGRLAASFKQTDDVKGIEITLRPDAKFHDGSPVTAKDVAYTLDRLKKLGAGVATLVTEYDSTDVTDDTHLTIKLTTPSSLFLGALSKIYILNSALIAQNAGDDDGQAWLQGHDAGSGPFTLANEQGGDITVDLFDGYWDKQPDRPQSIVFRRMDESAPKRDELIAGNIDLGLDMSGRDAQTLSSNPDLQVVKLKAPSEIEVIFNTRKGITTDPKIRRALRLVYDVNGGLAKIRSGFGTPADGPLPNTLACRPELPAAKQDIAEAKKMLADAGQSDLHLTMRFQPVFGEQKQEATLLQSNMKEAGVTIDLQPIAFPNYLASLKDPDQIPQMMLLEDFAQFPDPGIVLLKGYKSTAIGSNRSGYSNPKVDQLLDEALASPDAAHRCDLYKQVQQILYDDAVMIDMYNLTKPAVYRKAMLADLKASPTVSPIAPAQLRLVAGK